jgi:hypothetical protein
LNSDRLNRWITLGANIGVLIGIMLLVVELTQNHEMMRAQIRNDISQQLSNRLSMLASNQQLANLKLRAESGEELTAEEEHRFFLIFVAIVRDWENIHYQYRQGMFDENEFNAERNAWRFVTNENPAFRRNWCLTRQNYSGEFAAEIEKLSDSAICEDTVEK